MRLTLRTLLAYLCGLLEPEDAQDIKRKISQPGRGQQLAQRIPKLVARRELDAPRLDSKAAGADPNMVAEYLDGILSPERTAEFDRVCLQSDRQLAEVASCFEILSVVRRPIKVSSGLRQSMYRVIDTVARHDAATRSDIPANQLDSHYELSEEDRAAILEEYVDAPALKPARPGRSQTTTDPSTRDVPSSEGVDSIDARQAATRSRSPWRNDEESKPSANSLAGPPIDAPTDGNDDDSFSDDGSLADDDDLVISADKNWFESDLESFLKTQDGSEKAPVDEFGAEIESPAPPTRQSKTGPAQVITPTVFADHEDDEPDAPPVSEDMIQPVGAGANMAIHVNAAKASRSATLDSRADRDRGSSDSLRRWLPVIVVGVLAILLGGVLFVVMGGSSRLLGSRTSNQDETETQAEEETGKTVPSDASQAPVSPDGNTVDEGEPKSGSEETRPTDDTVNSEAQQPAVPKFNAPDLSAPRDGDHKNPPTETAGDGFPVLKMPDEFSPQKGTDEAEPMEIELPDPNAALGQLLGRNGVLARYDAAREGWFRVPVDGAIQRVDRLLNFPSYHTKLQFGENIQVELNGATGMEVLGVVQDRPQLALRFGKLSATSAVKPNTEFNLQVDDIQAKVTLVEEDSRIAVRRLAFLPPGTDPIAVGGEVLVDVVAVRGRVIWEDSNGPKIMDAGQAQRYVDGVASDLVTLPSIPYWIDSQVADIDLRGSETVAGLLANDRPIEGAFRELIEDPHVEVRMLAVQCLSLLGEHEPLINALGNERNKSYWTDLIEWVRSVLARGSAQAESVYGGIQKANPDHAAVIYRLIVGFSEGQVVGGADAELIDLLESDDLMLRVLAADNLLRITGSRGMYRPETSERIRESHVRTWRKQLDQGAIRYSQAPARPSINGSRMGE